MHHHGHCGVKVLPPVVHPTKCCVKHSEEMFVVPHIFPTHTTHVNHQIFANESYYPQTNSFVNDPHTINVGPGHGHGHGCGCGCQGHHHHHGPRPMPYGGF